VGLGHLLAQVLRITAVEQQQRDRVRAKDAMRHPRKHSFKATIKAFERMDRWWLGWVICLPRIFGINLLIARATKRKPWL